MLQQNTKDRKSSTKLFDGQKVNFSFNFCFLDEVITQSDFISINTAKTLHYILDSEEFSKMKDGVFIVNAARGGVLNEVTLLDFIEEGKIAGAALDVLKTNLIPNFLY